MTQKNINQYLEHISSADDLLTSYEATRAGFLSLALEKNRKATPYVDEARALQKAALKAKNAADLVKIKGIEVGLLTASGLSDKSLKHLEEPDKTQAIRQLIKNFLEPAGSQFVDELVYRFLLTRGDALGGKVRNIGGLIAQEKLMRTILSCLSIAGIESFVNFRGRKTWKLKKDIETETDASIAGLYWKFEDKDRCLKNNITVPFIGTNVDMCIFNQPPKLVDINNPNHYVALGELKGGIDPAGADEHWKTADSALNRIRTAFERINIMPSIFFIGAAIEKRMSVEIWDQLVNKSLTNAANLTDNEQLISICRWLCFTL
ncbi:MAG: AvaI/BsoBI family type II restriction endonuclease [Candidatus Cloacimonetes bacterium]|nr:AvaI/BsoBI family type II restriction endonuclease [Candidatus Cloacimonadota bacterium]